MKGGALIREARLRKGLTQAELARRLGTSQSVVARWESGRTEPGFRTVVRAIRACGLEPTIHLVELDPDHDRLIQDHLHMSPQERLADLLHRLELEQILHGARPR